MSALIYLSTHSLKNRIITAFKNPKLVMQILGVLLFTGIIIIGIVTGVGFELRAPRELIYVKGLMFVLFFLPYWAGRYSGGGSFGMDDVNLVFTSPVLPRTMLLGGLYRRLGGMVVIVFTVIIAMLFVSITARIELSFSQFVFAGLFGFVLMVVSKLFGIYLFVAYKKVYRWIGFFWCILLGGVFVYFTANAGWDWGSGFYGLLGSHIFELTPLVGWAAAGAYRFVAGDVLWGIVYTGLLLATGGYFFTVIYLSRPDFYEDALEGYHDSSKHLAQLSEDALPKSIPVPYKDKGAAAFFYKHMREKGVSSRLGMIDKDIFIWATYAILWGLYVRLDGIGIEEIAMFFRLLGVPHQSILAVLLPLVFAAALLVEHDSGFKELRNPVFYMLPDAPVRKLIWVSMSRIINVAITAGVVFALAGAISGTAISNVILGFMAYLACEFMALGLKMASGRLFGVTSRAGRSLAATLSVVLCILVGWVGLMAIFFVGGNPWGMLIGLIAFFTWCMIIGGLAFLYAVRVLHDVDVV